MHRSISGFGSRVKGCAWVLAAFLVLLVLPLRADDAAADGLRIKAAEIYHFVEYTTWPARVLPDPASPILIGLLGDDPLAEHLKALEGKKIGTHPILYRPCHTVEEARTCQVLVLYIPDDPRGGLRAALSGLDSLNVLTIGEGSGFAKAGGIIGFDEVDHQLRFIINAPAAERAGLKLSSQLLKLARPMPGGGP